MCRAVLVKAVRAIQLSHLGQVLPALWVGTLISDFLPKVKCRKSKAVTCEGQ